MPRLADDFSFHGPPPSACVRPDDVATFTLLLKAEAAGRLGDDSRQAIETAAYAARATVAMLGADPDTSALPVTVEPHVATRSIVYSVRVPQHSGGGQIVVYSIVFPGSGGAVAGLPAYLSIAPVPFEASEPLAGAIVPGTMASPCITPGGTLFVPRGGLVSVYRADGSLRPALQASIGPHAPQELASQTDLGRSRLSLFLPSLLPPFSPLHSDVRPRPVRWLDLHCSVR
jgi:hypothetical protein